MSTDSKVGEARAREVLATMSALDPDSMAASGTDLWWLIGQLAIWPARFDHAKTTNIRFLMLSAARTLAATPVDAISVGDDLAWFSDQRRLSLASYSATYGDDDDQSEEWRVHRQGGSINDREWTTVGRGETPLAAIQSARTTLAKGH